MNLQCYDCELVPHEFIQLTDDGTRWMELLL